MLLLPLPRAGHLQCLMQGTPQLVGQQTRPYLVQMQSLSWHQNIMKTCNERRIGRLPVQDVRKVCCRC